MDSRIYSVFYSVKHIHFLIWLRRKTICKKEKKTYTVFGSFWTLEVHTFKMKKHNLFFCNMKNTYIYKSKKIFTINMYCKYWVIYNIYFKVTFYGWKRVMAIESRELNILNHYEVPKIVWGNSTVIFHLRSPH